MEKRKKMQRMTVIYMFFSTCLTLILLVSLHCHSESNNTKTKEAVTKTNGASAELVLRDEEGKEVTFQTKDNIIIVGTLWEAAEQPSPAILCLHQWRSDRSAYDKIAQTLRTKGFTVLAIDMRGNGSSQKNSDGKQVKPDRIAREDVSAAIVFLRSRKSVDGTRIGILGASYGSSNALLYAASDKSIKTVVLLSPGLNYFNVLPTEPAAKQYGSRPIFAAASSEDVRSVEAIQRFNELLPNGLESIILENAGHGTAMLETTAELTTRILAFFLKNL